MPDHIHLFAAFGPQAMSTSEWMNPQKRDLESPDKRDFQSSALAKGLL
jgi:hypothetical protein